MLQRVINCHFIIIIIKDCSMAWKLWSLITTRPQTLQTFMYYGDDETAMTRITVSWDVCVSVTQHQVSLHAFPQNAQHPTIIAKFTTLAWWQNYALEWTKLHSYIFYTPTISVAVLPLSEMSSRDTRLSSSRSACSSLYTVNIRHMLVWNIEKTLIKLQFAWSRES